MYGIIPPGAVCPEIACVRVSSVLQAVYLMYLLYVCLWDGVCLSFNYVLGTC